MKPRTSSSLPVLLVDDESTVLLSSKMVLSSAGIGPIETVQDSRELIQLLSRQQAAVVVLDLFMPYIPGSQLLPEIIKQFPELPVIVMTAAQEVDTAVACMKEGAFDYLVKPVEESRFVSSVKRALEIRLLRRQVDALKHYLISDDLEHSDVFAPIITTSRKMRALFQYMEATATSNEPVLISGETGVGKELLAEALHRLSGRHGKLVQVNVAGLDDNLFADSLFGHKKGAYTGADTSREWLVAQAAGGTLFLDEIGDLKTASQIKLLRLLEEKQYYPLGSDVAKAGEARVICATNRSLQERMSKDHFRSDLYFRLSVHQICVPPLRERIEDIPVLVDHFIENAAQSMDKKAPQPPPELYTLLATYHFPGNVRELRAMIFDAVAQHKTGRVLSMKSFHRVIQAQQASPLIEVKGQDKFTDRFPTLKEAERLHIQAALRQADGNQGIAATLLGISRPALNRRLAHLNTSNSE
ncbi:MAG: sigma-54-dependent Fis family transcriptional regulator [Proteobacteria bacterium]|nr:sigma-54-dependent Fis family transcriptional regulator [Pseudomonadota bacterium]